MTQRLMLIACLLCGAMAIHAQNVTLQQQEDEDSTIAVIGYFCKNDTLEYNHITGKEKIVGNDTTLLTEVKERIMVVVTDSTSDGYKMELIPMACEVVSHSDKVTDRLIQPVWNRCKDLRCRFTTDEYGAVQHIENWREIRDVLKKTYTMVFDSIYASMPGIDSVMPRKNLENLMMLGCTTEDGIKNIYEELDILFGLHGTQLAIGVNESDDVSESGYPTHSIIDVFYSAQGDEYDFDGDYVVQGRTTTQLSPEDADDLLGSILGVFIDGVVKDSIDKYSKELFASNGMGMTVTNNEQYCYFYNGWPKLMHKVVETSLGDKMKRVEYDMIEWTSRRWGVFTVPEQEEQEQKM